MCQVGGFFKLLDVLALFMFTRRGLVKQIFITGGGVCNKWKGHQTQKRQSFVRKIAVNFPPYLPSFDYRWEKRRGSRNIYRVFVSTIIYPAGKVEVQEVLLGARSPSRRTINSTLPIFGLTQQV